MIESSGKIKPYRLIGLYKMQCDGIYQMDPLLGASSSCIEHIQGWLGFYRQLVRNINTEFNRPNPLAEPGRDMIGYILRKNIFPGRFINDQPVGKPGMIQQSEKFHSIISKTEIMQELQGDRFFLKKRKHIIKKGAIGTQHPGI